MTERVLVSGPRPVLGHIAELIESSRACHADVGEALAVPDGAAAVGALANQLKPGDVVLVKASRAAHLEGVAVLLAGGATPRNPPARGGSAPHHFELAGWAETTIVVRFWIIAGICVALGLGIFYVG